MTHTIPPRHATLALLAAMTLAACTQPSQRPDAPPAASHANASLLDDYRWQLREAHDAAGQPLIALTDKPGAPLALRLDAGRVQIANGCNPMGAAATLHGAMIQVGDVTSTLKACADERLMRLDAAAAKALHGRLAWTLQAGDPPQLTLTNAAGEVLRFTGEATPETRYGGPGETVFLEVAAQTQPCHHPLIRDMQCLEVREVRFDDRGVRTTPAGDFQHFYDEIEGYRHQPGVRNVLRVKRYKIANPPADASNRAWVLDLVVESETVNP